MGVAVAMMLMASGSTALAQPAKPALTRDLPSKRNWTLHAEVRIHTYQPQAFLPRDIQATPPMVLDSVKVVYPLIGDTACSDARPDLLAGKFTRVFAVLDDAPEVESGYQGLSSLAVWEASNIRTTQLVLEVDISMTSYETRIDEKAARLYRWPAAEWSPELALCLEPQLFVESNDPAVRGLVSKWLTNNPKGAPPYTQAKKLAAAVIDHVRLTETNFEQTGRGILVSKTDAVFISGYRVSGASYAARQGTGSEYDIACLYVAALRAAGIPARLVIGFDIKEAEKQRQFPVLRSWVEFFLARDPKPSKPAPGTQPADAPVVTPDLGEWIPVDITRQKRFSSKAPPLSQPWYYFGHNEESDFLCPFAHHWHPPETVTNAGAAAIWGWRPLPANPAADQEIRFWAIETVQVGGQQGGRKR